MSGLGPRRLATVRALMPALLGLAPDEAALVPHAAARLGDYVRALPDRARATEIGLVVDAMAALCTLREGATPATLPESGRRRFAASLFDGRRDRGEGTLDAVLRLRGRDAPSTWDVARAFFELCAISFWSGRDAGARIGWTAPALQARLIAIDPGIARPPFQHSDERFDQPAIDLLRARPSGPYFRGDGRPRVAIIGSGPGGAAAASVLAPHADVVVFEAGPRFRPDQYPVDALVAMATLYESGLLSPTADLDIRVLRARLVGGGSAVNEGVSVRPRAALFERWRTDHASFDRAALEAALDAASSRQRFRPLAEDLTTDAGPAWRRGFAQLSGARVEPVLSDLATDPRQHGSEPAFARLGERCVACGLCNFGCRFGQHRTVDRTFLADAEALGARVFANLPIDRVSARADGGVVRVDAIFAGRERIDVDAVVLAAGATGSAPLLLRSAARDRHLSRIPPARADQLGAGFGFNYGAPVIARFASMGRPGSAGIQTHFIGRCDDDQDTIYENGWVPPGVMAAALPGWGSTHRRFVGEYQRLGFAVNTIASPSTGSIDAQGTVRYRISSAELGGFHRTLARLVDGWLRSGAVEVRPGGVQPMEVMFDATSVGREAAIAAQLREVIERAEHLPIGSGHPQGGLRMNDAPDRGAVDARLRLHGVENLWVGDASVFPTTIAVNPQWLVMAIGLRAGAEALASLRRAVS